MKKILFVAAVVAALVTPAAATAMMHTADAHIASEAAPASACDAAAADCEVHSTGSACRVQGCGCQYWHQKPGYTACYCGHQRFMHTK